MTKRGKKKHSPKGAMHQADASISLSSLSWLAQSTSRQEFWDKVNWSSAVKTCQYECTRRLW
jgi:hypothetical protein